jgi:hypothetical protein
MATETTTEKPPEPGRTASADLQAQRHRSAWIAWRRPHHASASEYTDCAAAGVALIAGYSDEIAIMLLPNWSTEEV